LKELPLRRNALDRARGQVTSERFSKKPLRRWSWYAGDVAITGSFSEDAHHDREET
jgi:hypothetical protein